MKKKNILSIVLAGSLLVSIFSACAPNIQQAPEPGGTAAAAQPAAGGTAPAAAVTPPPVQAIERGVIFAIGSEAPTVAPGRHTSLNGHFFNVMTHNGLFRVEYANATPVLDLAESVTAISDTVFEFRVREGILFHNGEALTAYDVVASLYYLRTHPIAAGAQTAFSSAEVIDRYTLRIDTGEPNALLFVEQADHRNFVMPKSLIDAGHDFMTYPIGSGPFVFDNWVMGDSKTFTRFDNYFDTERSATIPYAVFRIIPEGSSRTIALETGEVHYLVNVSFPDVPRLKADPGITVFERDSLSFNYLLLNNEHPHFSNKYVRHAIDMAIDKEALVISGVDGFGIPTWQNMPQLFPGSTTENSRSFDPAGAKALLAQHNIDASLMEFEVLVVTEEERRMAEVIQANLADIGMAVSISGIDLATWLTVTSAGDYEASLGTFTANNIISFMRNTMHSDFIGTQNRIRKSVPEYDALISQAVATIDVDARVAIMTEASRIANDHAGFIPLYMSVIVRAFSSNLIVPETGPNGFIFPNMMYWIE